MANYSVLKAAVEEVVKTNGNEEITGANLQSTLLSIINSLGTGYQFMGVATPSTTPPSSPDYNIAYICGDGTYVNFGTSITIPSGSIGVFKYNGSWVKNIIKLFNGIDDNPTAGSTNIVQSGGVFNELTDISLASQQKMVLSIPRINDWYSVYTDIPEYSAVYIDVTPDTGSISMYVRLKYANNTQETFPYLTSVQTLTKYTAKRISSIDILCGSEMTANTISISYRYKQVPQNDAYASFQEKVSNGLTGELTLPRFEGKENIIDLYAKKGESVTISITPDTGGVGVYIKYYYADGTSITSPYIETTDPYTRYLPKELVKVGFIYGSSFPAENYTITVVKNTYGAIYVNSNTGSDTYWGTAGAPVKTIAKALELCGEDATLYIAGTFRERINLKDKQERKSVKIIGAATRINRIMWCTEITSATSVATDVYSYDIASFPSADTSYAIWQDGISDTNTAISQDEKHPLQRGKSYRLDATKLNRVASQAAVTSSSVPCFYYNESTGKLYFRTVAGSSLTDNPVVLPSNDPVVYGNDGTVAFEAVNVDFCYSHLWLDKCNGARLIECSAKYGCNGGFHWLDANGIEFVRCEACGITDYDGVYGDGFSAGTSTSSATLAKCGTAVMYDCWSHDNHDDGYSDHINNETTIDGGLFEYNDGGITTSYGSHDIVRNVLSRKNTEAGITVFGAYTEGTDTYVMNCICENNADYNYSVVTGGTYKTKGTFVNCISISAAVAGFYNNGTNTIMVLRNCYDYGSPSAKSGTITIVNANLVN